MTPSSTPGRVGDADASRPAPIPDGGRPDRAGAVRQFYGRWAAVYDAVARHAPLVDRYRRRAVAALDLEAGDTVVELGCGSGANLGHLRRAVGDAGRVLGVDLTPELLARAGDRAADHGWENVSLVRGDASRPPLSGPVDGVLATFLLGLLDRPAAAVRRWAALVGAGGRVASLEATRSDHAVGRLFNPAFDAFVAAGSPSGASAGGDPAARLDDRVAAADHALASVAAETRRRRGGLGFLRLIVGTVD
ncbi:MAG: class I SAM-dependent methyltransferase [Halobacteriaceae archaeon]